MRPYVGPLAEPAKSPWDARRHAGCSCYRGISSVAAAGAPLCRRYL